MTCETLRNLKKKKMHRKCVAINTHTHAYTKNAFLPSAGNRAEL